MVKQSYLSLLFVIGFAQTGMTMQDPSNNVEEQLIMAAYSGDEGACRRLIARETNVNAKNDAGVTPLHVAAAWGHIGICELLLASGAEVDARDAWGNTPFLNAAKKGHYAILNFLALSGADIHVRNRKGRTANYAILKCINKMEFSLQKLCLTVVMDEPLNLITLSALAGISNCNHRTP
jgi:ankyrin repeat protein